MKTRSMLVILLAGCVLCSWALGETGKKEQLAQVSCKHPKSKLKNKTPVKPEEDWEPEFIPIFLDVPEKYSGWKITTDYYDYESSNKHLNVKVKKAGILTLSAKSRNIRNLSADGWKEVGRYTVQRGVDKKVEHIILEKYMEEGEYQFKRDETKTQIHPCLLVER